MDRIQARDELRGHLEEYIAEFHGVQNTRRNFRCLNPNHEDSNPSMGFDKAHNRVHCFSCGASYDIIDLIKLDRGMATDREAFAWGYENYCIDVDGVTNAPLSSYRPQQTGQGVQNKQGEARGQDFTTYFRECAARMEDSPGMEYLRRRGLHDEIIRRFGLGYDSAFNRATGPHPWQAVIIPTGPDSFVARNVNVQADDGEHKGDRVRKSGHSRPFNLVALQDDMPVFIVEGEIDALSVIDCGGQAVGLGSTANVNALLQYIDDNRIKPIHPLQISLDNDDDGREAARKLAEELGKRGIAFRVANIAGEYKDPNEAIVKDRLSFTGAIHEAECYEDEAEKKERDDYFRFSASGSMGDFLKEVEHNKVTPPISTGFMELDGYLGGGLYEGLIIVGAISSLGKTAFALQIADNIAKGDAQHDGRDVLIVALEMGRFELMARSISRETFEAVDDGMPQNIAKTTREILNGQGHELFNDTDAAAIRNAEAAYNRYGSHIFILEGIGNIGAAQVREAVEKHVKVTGQVPVVVLDYLQLLAPDDPRATDKQNIDKAVLELKRISRDFRMPVIVISSFNRMNYQNPVLMESFKESGAIEYSSDVLLGLQLEGAGCKGFNVDAAKRQEPRQIEVVVLKNRNGRTGGKLRFSFYAAYNCFEESLEEDMNPERTEQRMEFCKIFREEAQEDAGSFYLSDEDDVKEVKRGYDASKDDRGGNVFRGVDLKPQERDAWENYKLAASEFGELNEEGEFCGLTLEAWRPVFRKYSTASGEKAKDKQFDKMREALKKAGRIRVENDIYWPDGFLSGNEIKAISEKLKLKFEQDKQLDMTDSMSKAECDNSKQEIILDSNEDNEQVEE